MAMEPTLSVYDVRDAGARAANGKPVAATLEFVDERLQLLFLIHHKLDVVSGRPTDIPVTMLIGNITDIANEIHAHDAACADANRVNFCAGF